MARPDEKKASRKHNEERAFISERVRDLAVMYLTRRSDLEVKCQENGDKWVDCIVEITGKDKPSRRMFGVELRGTMSPVTDDHANKVLLPSMQSMRRRGDFPFPVYLLYFTMKDNGGRFTWIAEPVIKDGKPALQYHEKADTKKFDRRTLDEIVDKINRWFDAMPGDEGNVACAKCGTILYGESPGCDPSDRSPCPRCGSTARSFSVSASDRIHLSSAVQTGATTYWQRLLETARELFEKEHYNEAVMMAYMACAIATERSFAEALAAKKSQSPEEAANYLPGGDNLANERTRELYTALTGDVIQEQPFWQQFKKFVNLRNQIVHSRKTASRAEAEVSLKAASSLVRHLNK